MAEATEKQDELRKVYKDHNLHVLFGVTLMAVLGVSSVTPALPEIRQAFGVTTGQVRLLITAFTLPGIVFTPVLGVLSDRHGRKRILAPALLLFGVAGGMCIFVRDFQLLLGLRFLQGMGGSALGTLNVTVIGDIYSGRERFGAPSFLRGVVLTCASLVTADTSAQFGNLTGRFSEQTLLRASFIVYAVALTGMAFAPSLWLLLVPAALFGMAQGINIPNIFSLLNSIAPSENRDAFMSINDMTLRAGQPLGPLLIAAVSGLLGLIGAYLAAACLAILTFFLALILVR